MAAVAYDARPTPESLLQRHCLEAPDFVLDVHETPVSWSSLRSSNDRYNKLHEPFVVDSRSREKRQKYNGALLSSPPFTYSPVQYARSESSKQSFASDLDHPGPEAAEGIGTWEAVATLANTFIGAGTVGLPHVVAQAGISLSVVILLVVVAIMICTALVIVFCLREAANEGIAELDFGLLGSRAFGARGRAWINLVVALEVWLAAVNFLVLIGVNAEEGFGLRSDVVIAISGVLTLALFRVPMKVLATLAAMSLFIMVGLFVELVDAGSRLDRMAYQVQPIVWVQWDGLVPAVGTFLFCFAGHPCVPSIYAASKEKDKFPLAVLGGFAIAAVYYASCAVVGYLVYGSDVRPSFVSNVGKSLSGHVFKQELLLPWIAAFGLLLKLQATLPILMTPVLMALGWSRPRERVFLVAVTCLAAALLRQYLDSVMAVTGLVAVVTTSILFPGLIYLQLGRPGPIVVILVALGCVLSVLFAVGGTVQTVLGAS
mmetsp:Transcript_86825/g.232712  ORF Transcript_86825/g.232712 Transcript_86825/m.232712 type:complete len:487 (+) Transcript_86825:13-1473(+)